MVAPIGKQTTYQGQFKTTGFGLDGKIGYQIQVGQFFASPYAQLSLYRQNAKNYSLYRYTILNASMKSVQAALGSRIGYTFFASDQQSSITPYMDIVVGRELINSNKVYLGDGYVNAATKGNTVYTAVGSQLNLGKKTAGYVNIGYQNGKDSNQTSVNLGFNYLW